MVSWLLFSFSSHLGSIWDRQKPHSFIPALGTVNHKLGLCSMHPQVVIVHHSEVKARSQPGMHGRPVMRLQKHS